MSENNCNRCGRELMDPNADYGWRCAKKVGVKYGSDSVDWDLRGFRVAVDKAESFLKRNRLTIHENERENFYKAVVNMMVATYYDDVCAWEEAFWHMYYALFPNDKGKNGKTDAVQSANMQTMLDLVKWISEADMPKSMSSTSKFPVSGELPEKRGEVPKSSPMPISPLDVLEKMINNGYDKRTGKKKDDTEEGSILFWTEKLPSLGGRSRMEAWTFPIPLEKIMGDGILYNFREDRPSGLLHSAIDILTADKTPVHAVTDGIVVDQRYFPISYRAEEEADETKRVYQLIVLNFDGSIVRYCEMYNMPITAGTVVRQGDIVGYTKKMNNTMLHIEVYDNKHSSSSAYKYNLSSGNSNYGNVIDANHGRRSDLVNPTMIGALSIYTGQYDDLAKMHNPSFNWR